MSIDYTEQILKEKVLVSHNYSDLTRNLGLQNHCGNRNTVKKYLKLYNINVSHFDYKPDYSKRRSHKGKPLNDILIEHSTYGRKHIKARLFKEGIKQPICELCGQDEWWHGKRMCLILDHINGINDDNRLENLRIICPNCSGTLETNGGKNIKHKPIPELNKILHKKLNKKTKYCECGHEIYSNSKLCVNCAHIAQRKTNRPSIEILQKDVNELGYKGTGRKYGVSDNAIRKWLKNYKGCVV